MIRPLGLRPGFHVLWFDLPLNAHEALFDPATKLQHAASRQRHHGTKLRAKLPNAS